MLTGMLGMLSDVTTSMITEIPPTDPPAEPPVETEDAEAEPVADASGPEPDEPGEPDDEQPVSLADMRKLRKENASRRKSEQATEDKYKKLQQTIAEEKRAAELEKMEETDRLKAIATDAESNMKALQTRADRISKESAVINAAASMGFMTPQDAADLLDLSRITIDADGKMDTEAVSDMVVELAESRPYLVAPAKETSKDLFGPTNPKADEDYIPMPKFHDKRQTDRLRNEINKNSASGNLSGAALIMARRDLERRSGKNVQAERDGNKRPT